MKRKSPYQHVRFRDYSVVTYVPPEDFAHVLELCKHFAYIRHEQDNNAPHYHVLLRFINGHTPSATKSLFGLKSSQNTLVEYMSHPYSCFEYLTHSDCPEKYQYSLADVVCDSLFYWQSLIDEDDTFKSHSRILQLLDDIISEVPYRLMVERYGRDYVINYDRYKIMADRISGKNIPTKDEDLPF